MLFPSAGVIFFKSGIVPVAFQNGQLVQIRIISTVNGIAIQSLLYMDLDSVNLYTRDVYWQNSSDICITIQGKQYNILQYYN